MWQKLCDIRQRACVKMNAAVLNNPSEMVRQMAFPLVAEHRTQRALEIVSRETGLTYSKIFRLYYRRAHDVWREENQKLTAAFRRFAAQQERLYRERADTLAAVNAEIERLEGQHALGFLTSDQSGVGELDAEARSESS